MPAVGAPGGSGPPDLRVAAYAVVTADREVLLAHWNEGGRQGWTLPGGGLEPGEDPLDAVVREVEEETGHLVAVDGILGVRSHVVAAADRVDPDATAPLHTIGIVYRAHVTGGSLRDEIGGTTDRAAWVPLAEVAALDRVAAVDLALRWAGLLPPG